MAATNIVMYVVAALLTSAPLVIHADCGIENCRYTLELTDYPRGVAEGRCLRCSFIAQDELVTHLGNQTTYENVDGLITRYIDFSNIPITDKRIQKIVFIEINNNQENMNFTLIENFSKLRYFEVYMSNIHNEFIGYNVSSSQSNLTINFNNNNIKTIKSICRGYYRPAWSLNLGNNEIKSFTKSHIGRSNCTSKLWWLNLSNNQLTSLFSDIFLELPVLEFFYVSHNQISKFENNLNTSFPEIKVKHLDMGYNKLSTLNDEAFKYLFNLETLKLNNNNLKYLSINVLSLLIKLKNLNLSNNKLYFLDSEIFTKSNALEVLSVAGNHLIIFDLQNIQQRSNLAALQYIDLTRNQWDCKVLEHLIKYLSEKHINCKIDKENVINAQNVSGINCYSSVTWESIIQLRHTIENKLYQQIKLIENKQISEQKSNTHITADFQNSLKEMKVYIVILAAVLMAMIVLPVCVVIYVRHRRSRDAGGERYADSERAPERRQEPVYHYVQTPVVHHNRKSHMYEELRDKHPSTIRVGEHVDSEKAPEETRREEPVYLEPRVCNSASPNQGPRAVTSSDSRPAGASEAGCSSSPACDELAATHTPVYTEIIG